MQRRWPSRYKFSSTNRLFLQHIHTHTHIYIRFLASLSLCIRFLASLTDFFSYTKSSWRGTTYTGSCHHSECFVGEQRGTSGCPSSKQKYVTGSVFFTWWSWLETYFVLVQAFLSGHRTFFLGLVCLFSYTVFFTALSLSLHHSSAWSGSRKTFLYLGTIWPDDPLMYFTVLLFFQEIPTSATGALMAHEETTVMEEGILCFRDEIQKEDQTDMYIYIFMKYKRKTKDIYIYKWNTKGRPNGYI